MATRKSIPRKNSGKARSPALKKLDRMRDIDLLSNEPAKVISQSGATDERDATVGRSTAVEHEQ